MRRSKEHITQKILEVCAESPCSKTKVVYQANLNFNTANHHMAELLKMGLLEEAMRGSMVVYQTTSKGIDFKEQIKDIDKMMVRLELSIKEIYQIYRSPCSRDA